MPGPRSILVALLALGALAGGAVLWLLQGGGERPSPAGLAPAEADAPAEEPATLPGARELASPDAAGASAVARTAAAAEATGETESFELDGARWVDVRLVVPDGSPLDDSLAAFLFTAPRESGESGEPGEPGESGAGQRAVARIARRLLGRERRWDERPGPLDFDWSRRAFDGAASARLPAPAGAPRAWIVLDGRYLYLDAPQAVELAPPPPPSTGAPADTVTLEPRLGAWLTGRFELPSGAAARGVYAASFESRITLISFSQEAGIELEDAAREASVEGTLEFEVRALRAGVRYLVSAEVELLARASEARLRVEPGEHAELVLRPRLGGVVSGTVRDPRGAPVGGATARADQEAAGGFLLGFGADRSAETAADGRYAISGVEPGTLTVDVTKEGWIGGRSEELEIQDGEEVAGVDVAIEPGARVAGRVVWPDGSPAGGAEVDVSQKRSTERGFTWLEGVGKTETDASGSFSVSGIGEALVVVHATAEKQPEEEPGSVETAEIPAEKWFAHQADVAVGRSDLELRLGPTLALAGVVRDDAGAPVTSFRVSAALSQAGAGFGGSAGAGGRVEADFEDAAGRFELGGLHPGTWSLQLTAEGHRPPREPLEVGIPRSGAPLEITLARSAEIRGVVVDPQGAPIGGAEVGASRGPRPAFGRWGDGSSRTKTDADGTFRLAGVAPGTIALSAEHADWAASVPTPVEIAAGGVAEGVVLALRAGGTIRGHVYDDAGEPQAGRRIGLGENAFAVMGMAFGGDDAGQTSDASGAFTFLHVTPGEYSVTAMPSEDDLFDMMGGDGRDEEAVIGMFSKLVTERVSVADGAEAYVRLGAAPRRPVRVHGRVTAGDQPVTDTRLFVVAEGGSILQGMKLATTDPQGAYEVTVDRPGAYSIGVQIDDDGGPGVEFPIDVPDADELRVDLALPLGGIEGIVYQPDGKPANSIPVSLDQDGAAVRLGDMSSEWSDADGRFRFEHLRPGEYTLRAGGGGPFGAMGGARGATGGARAVTIASGVNVRADEVTGGVELRLTDGGRVEGTVRDAAGQPVVGAAVFVRDSKGRLLSRLSTTSTDAGGHYEYRSVPPGEVTVSARSSDAAASDSAPTRVAAGETAQVDLTVEPATTIVLIVEDEDGNEVRARISVADERGFEVGGMLAQSAMEAAFSAGLSTREQRVGPLPAGKYTVRATTSDGRTAARPVSLRGQEERTVRIRLRD